MYTDSAHTSYTLIPQGNVPYVSPLTSSHVYRLCTYPIHSRPPCYSPLCFLILIVVSADSAHTPYTLILQGNVPYVSPFSSISVYSLCPHLPQSHPPRTVHTAFQLITISVDFSLQFQEGMDTY